ncbi:MAG: outer membrane protein [Candidatus Rhabdochlamydia sp.]
MKNISNKFSHILIIAFCLATSSTAYASIKQHDKHFCSKNMHVSIKGGGSFLSDNIDKESFSKKHDASTLFGAGIGYKFNKDFSLDLTLTNRPNYQYSVPNADLLPGVPGNATQAFSSTALMLEGYYTPFEWRMFSPYIVAGAGVSYNVMGDYDYKVDGVSGEIIDFTIIGKGTADFSWSIGIGTKAKVNDYFSIDIGYRYTSLGKASTSNIALSSYESKYSNESGYSVGGPVSAHECTLRLVYDF